MTYRDIIKLIEKDGWRFDHQEGSHKIFSHPTKPGIVVVAAGGKMSRDVPTGTLKEIQRQAGLK